MNADERGLVSHRLILREVAGWYELVVRLRRADGEWPAITGLPERLTPEARRPPGQVIVDSIDAQ